MGPQESRNERLNHYCIFERLSTPALPIKNPEPLCFNPSKDIICLPYGQIFPAVKDQQKSILKPHLVALSEKDPRHINKTKHLHITSVTRFRSPYGAQELFNLHTREDGAALQCYPGAYNTALLHFPALRKIILEIRWAEIGDNYWMDENKSWMDDITASVQQFVEVHRDKFHGGKAPEVVAIWYPDPRLEERDKDLYLKMEKGRVERLSDEIES